MIVKKYLLIVDEKEEFEFWTIPEANKKAIKFLDEKREICIIPIMVMI